MQIEVVGVYPYGEANSKAADTMEVSPIAELSMMPLLYVLQREGVLSGCINLNNRGSAGLSYRVVIRVRLGRRQD